MAVPVRYAFCLLLLAGCDEGPLLDGGIPQARIVPTYEPSADPMDFGAVPWPDDLYLDSEGRIAVGALPSEAEAIPPEFPDSLRDALSDLDGFSTSAPIFFFFPPDSLTEASLPSSPAETTREDASVFVWDVDPASADAFTPTPVVVHWNPALGQLALRPYSGHPLVPGRRYAAVVTTDVLDDLGEPIGAAPQFREVRDAMVRPEDPVLADAFDQNDEVLAGLASRGIDRARVAGLAVFTVQTVSPDLRDARERIWTGDAPVVTLDAVVQGVELDSLLGVPTVDQPGLDVPGGVAHSAIGMLVQGRFQSPWFVSNDPAIHGRWRRDSEGVLRSTVSDEVPFTLTLPDGGDLERIRIVIYQHGLGSERSSMLAVADALAAAGYGVLAIDIPFHGMRASGSVVDVAHNYGDTTGPDGFGDVTGTTVYLDYLGVVDTAGPLPAFHPTYPRDMFRQSVVDLMTAVRMLREGDWSAVTATPGLELMAFAPEPFAFVGVSLGGIVGTIFSTVEPEIEAAVLNVTGGDLTALVERSAAFADLFLPILLPKLGLDPEARDVLVYPGIFHPELAIAQTLFDRGDSMAFAHALGASDKHLLFQMAENDETVPNSATEALARAAGAPILDVEPVFTDLQQIVAPASENVGTGAILSTRGLYRFAPATHSLLSRRSGRQVVEHPPEPPFVGVDPVAVSNPVDASLGQLVHFLVSWRSGRAEIRAAD